MPLLRWTVRGLAYTGFQLALSTAFLLRSIGALALPLRFHSADEASQEELAVRCTLPEARLISHTAL